MTKSFESIGHLIAKQYLRMWLLDECQSDRRTVWLEYPFFDEDIYRDFFGIPDSNFFKFDGPAELLDEFSCGSPDNPRDCTYRTDIECPCVRCSGMKPKYIADVVVRYKGCIDEIWEVVNKSDLSLAKLDYYRQLKAHCGIDFYVIPDHRITKQVGRPNLDNFRSDHRGK